MERVYTGPLLDKLGVRPGMRVAIVGDLDADPEAAAFREQLADRTGDVTEGPPKPDTDVVILLIDSTGELEILDELRRNLRPAGAIWVVSRKGKAATVRDVEVMAAAREHDLIDNKVVAFSAQRTSIRLVIPVALRPRV
jgi:xanthine/CO dehydrogenase XdhC/CoxF family maturation factor